MWPISRQSSLGNSSRKLRELGAYERCQGVETLESRTLLAGDLLAGLANDGTVSVLGDDHANGALVRTIHEEIPDALIVTGGTTSVDLELELLASVGLTLSGADADAPAPGYLVGFPITADTDFRISVDGSVPPLGGIEHEGTVRFNEDTLTIGNFTIGFDGSRVTDLASGFYVLDNVTFDAVLFDIGAPQIAIDGSNLTVTSDQLLVSPELAGVLSNDELVGEDVGGALIEAEVASIQQRQVHGGVTSVGLDPDALAAAELTLTGADGVVDPAAGPFQVGFPIGSDADFRFLLTDGELTPLSGLITHTGTVTFNDEVTVGDFEIGYDGDRANQETGATGFYVKDTFSVNAVLFDIAAPDAVELQDPDFTVGPADLLVSPEFGEFLGKPELIGADAGDAQINATVNQVVAPYLQVKGVRRYWRPTTVNGADSVVFPVDEVSNLHVDVGSGSDSVRLRGLDLPGSVSVYLGNGSFDYVSFDHVVAAAVSVDGGNGRDYVYLKGTSATSLTVDTGNGSDSVSLRSTQVSGPTNIQLGRANDRLRLYRSTLEGETVLDGGSGRFDSIYARYSDFEGEILNFRWKWIR